MPNVNVVATMLEGTDWVTKATEMISGLTTIAGQLVNFALDNWVLCLVFVGGTVSSVGFGFFKKAKKAVR